MIVHVDARADEEVSWRIILRIVLSRARLRNRPEGQEAALAPAGIALLNLVDLNGAVAQFILQYEVAALILWTYRIHLRGVAQLLREVRQLANDILFGRLRYERQTAGVCVLGAAEPYVRWHLVLHRRRRSHSRGNRNRVWLRCTQHVGVIFARECVAVVQQKPSSEQKYRFAYLRNNTTLNSLSFALENGSCLEYVSLNLFLLHPEIKNVIKIL